MVQIEGEVLFGFYVVMKDDESELSDFAVQV